ncbi:uncharacterized protein CDAR_411961 [Caerostris darwini]|uniref:Uncharacterized protein n=1 Tax=Caerostris darwini TaxID=1538125 RepID=A0AAV4WBP2_9ARAC|nr:uncharacterized protein CDAR_411961 [Caerostris darwini]
MRGTTGKQGASPKQCEESGILSCYEAFPREELEETGIVPSEEDLGNVCPGVLKMVKCVEEYTADCVDPSSHAYAFHNHEAELYKEICNASSSARANYLRNIECYQRLARLMIFQQCFQDGKNAYRLYIESVESIDPEKKFHQDCLELTYSWGCAAAEVKNKCSEEAYSVFLEIGRLRDSTLISFLCSHPHYEKELSGILQSVGASEEDKLIFNEMFRIMRN